MSPRNILGVILAGGRGRRMGEGGDKPLATLGGATMLDRVLERAVPQCGQVIINTNSDHPGYAAAGLPVVADQVAGFAGPLAGILAAMDWGATHAPGCNWLASFAADAPFIPRDLVARLAEAVGGIDGEGGKEGADMARAASFGRRHPVFGLWPVSIRAELRDRLVNDDIRKIDLFTADYKVAEVAFDGVPDPFFNVNTPEERAEAERIISAGDA